MRENDQTRDIATPAVIVAALRSGGTFLAHCLSNHPQVFCDRGEPLHNGSVWCSTLHPSRKALLSALLNQTGYRVSMCKLTYGQAFMREIWPFLLERQPKVIWLRRENAVRQAISVLINREARRGKIKRPQHTFSAARPGGRVTLDAEAVLKTARGLRRHDGNAGKRLRKLNDVLRLSYSELTGGEHASADRLPGRTVARICAFLGVMDWPMGSDLKRVNPYPLRDTLVNWRSVVQAVRDSEFASCLEDEQAWQ